MSSKLDAYRRNRWAVRMAAALELVARVSRTFNPLPLMGCWSPPPANGWEPCFDGLHRLFAIDARLAGWALKALTAAASGNTPVLTQLYRFSRRLNHMPTAWRCGDWTVQA